jgi:uncharacterized protein involved in exopolysaccharide biosynthesis
MMITLLAGAVAGSIIGLTAWSQLLLANSQATTVVSIGRYDQTSLIEDPLTIIDRIKSPNFVAAASARAGIPELSMLLPARQYGGLGALSVRGSKDSNLIEIRINLPQPDLAQKAITAIVDELVADHETRAAPLTQTLQSALTVLDNHASEMIKANDSITKRLNGSYQGGEIGEDSMTLLSARALTETGLGALVKSEIELRILASNVRKTQVVVAPTVTTSKPTSLYQIVAAGALVGLLVGLLLLQMFPGFFRTGRPSLETSGGAL